MDDKRLTHIRLPLQIGTSALWSLARTSVFFPGLVLVVLGLWMTWELREGGEAAIIGLGVSAAGGALIAFAYFHYKHLLAERPSDVLLDESGLRIEGGLRDGLALAWTEIDPDGCRIDTTNEKRVTTWRLILNLPLIAFSFAGGDDATVGLEQDVPVHRLFVVRKGTREQVLVAEADVDVEHRSLATLIRTIRSSRWHPGFTAMTAPAPPDPPAREATSSKRASKRKRAKAKQSQASMPRVDRPASITCPSCGAIAAPSADESATCRFCSASVPIPDDVRKRVGAAATLASARRSGMSRLEHLLASQPSARLATATMWAAAIPIAIAWPLAGVLVVHNMNLGMITPGRVAAIAILPLLVMLGAFLFARGRLTDRFALHAVVIGFGAHDPPRPGEPFRCRACEASLPDVTTTPVVYCVYCDKPNVLGLDLSRDAKEAKEEQGHLEEAFVDREKERVLWRVGTFAALALIVASVLVVRGTVADIKRVDFKPQYFTASVVSTDPKEQIAGMPPLDNAQDGTHVMWTAQIAPADGQGVNCNVKLQASAEHVNPFTYDHDGRCTFAGGRPVNYSDTWTTGTDHDPKVELDVRKETVVISDDYVDGDYVGRWKVNLRLRETR